jgi:hypothetical protein
MTKAWHHDAGAAARRRAAGRNERSRGGKSLQMRLAHHPREVPL